MPDTKGRKWELKSGDTVLGTIFYKPTTKKYSLWFSTPLVVENPISVATVSYQYKTLGEAVIRFRELFEEKIEAWAKSAIAALDLKWEPPDDVS
jgi:hypothetical protein